MAMRKKAAAAAKVRNAWRCPKCGHKIETVSCYGCLMEEERAKRQASAEIKLAKTMSG